MMSSERVDPLLKTLYGVATGRSLLEVPDKILMDCYEMSEKLNPEFDSWAVGIVYPVKCHLLGTWGIEWYMYVPDAEFEEVDWHQYKFPHPDKVRKHWISMLGTSKSLF